MNNTIVVTEDLIQHWKQGNLTKLSDIARKLRNRSKRHEVPEAFDVYNLINNFSLPVKELYPTLHKIFPQKFTKSNEDFNAEFTVKTPTTNDANKSHIIAKALLTVVPDDISTQNWLFNKECQKYILELITTHSKEIEKKNGVIDEINKKHATIMQEKDDEIRKAKEKLEEEDKVRTNEHEIEIDEIKKEFATIMQEKDDEIRKAKEKLEEEVHLSTSSIILLHDIIAKNKDDTVEPLKGKKQLESKHDVDVEEETINDKTLRKTKEESQNVLKAKEAKIKETPKQVNANYAKTEDEAIKNPTREEQETNKVSTKKGKTVVKAIRSSKFTNKVKDKRMSFFSSKNMKTAKLNKTIHYLETRLLKARHDSKKLTGNLKQRSKALTSQLQEKEKDLAKVTKENIEYKTKITNLTETNFRLKEKEEDLAKVTKENNEYKTRITNLTEDNYQLEALVDIKDIKINDYESYYGNFVKETTKISQDFAVDKVHNVLNGLMSSIKQVQEEFDKDAEMKNLGPKVSDLKRAFSQNIPDISFLEIKQDAGSIKRKKVTPMQHAKKQKRT